MKNMINELESLEKEGTFPGYQASFLENDTFINYTSGYSQMLPTKKKMPENFWFDLASLTKMLTGILTIKVFEEKNWDLKETLHYFYPAFSNKEVTVMSLLTHTAGLSGFIKNRNELSKEQLKEALLHLEPIFPVGEKCVYSDHHFLLLGMMLEEVTEKKLPQLLEEYLNQPLKTQFTYFPDKDKTIPTAAIFSKEGLWEKNLQGEVHDPKAKIFGGVAGHAGVFGRLEDLEKLLNNLVNFGSFFTKNELNLISEDQTKGLLRSAGFKLYPVGDHFAFSHTGYTGTLLIGDATLKKGFIFLSNRVHLKDERADYILKRDHFIQRYLSELEEN